MNSVDPARRNPGPAWGSAFLLWAERCWPRWFFRPAFMAGTWVALAFMPSQRAHSRAYLAVVLGRPPRVVELWRHFFAFADFLLLLLRTGRGAVVPCTLDPASAADFAELIDSGQPALFGTFHFGASDLLGYLLGQRGRRVSILRLKVGNSDDTRLLGERYGEHVSFLWVNDPSRLLFELKAALDAGESLALKCDRLEFSAKTEPFHFLGARRLFPFSIYHLSVLFDRPVIFCVALPAPRPPGLQIFASPVFTPNCSADRATNLAAARVHFQAVLAQLESLVRRHPLQWFNFIPLNPAVP